MTAKELEVKTEHLTYRALCWGEGEPVIALHGWLDNAGTFAELAPLLDGYQIMAFDLPGHGLSDRLPMGSWYHFVDNVWHLDRIVSELQLERFHLMGHSMGGGISLMFASAFSDRLKSLVSIDAPGPVSTQVSGTGKRIKDAVASRAKLKMAHRRYPSREEALAARQQSGELPLAGADHLAQRGLTKDEAGWYWRADRRLRMNSIMMFTEPQVLEMLSKIDTPTIFIDAAEGFKWAPAEVIQKRQSTVPNVKQVAIAGGHHLHLTNPEPCAREILSFWQAVQE